MPQVLRAGFPATLFAFVLAIVLVVSGLLFDRMAAVGPAAPVRVALLDRAPPARVEPAAGSWESVHPVLGTVVLETPPTRVAARSPTRENAPSRAQARRGDRKKQADPVFGPQPRAEEFMADEAGLRP